MWLYSRDCRTLTPSHLASVIQSDSRMDFLRTLVEKVPRAEAATSKTPLDLVTKKPARGAKYAHRTSISS